VLKNCPNYPQHLWAADEAARFGESIKGLWQEIKAITNLESWTKWRIDPEVESYPGHGLSSRSCREKVWSNALGL